MLECILSDLEYKKKKKFICCSTFNQILHIDLVWPFVFLVFEIRITCVRKRIFNIHKFINNLKGVYVYIENQPYGIMVGILSSNGRDLKCN